ncbi:hypothetical protein AcV7_006651 [Taiwanofungus camphoratus]|nr:hypothetical protein AcV7_006651 [Antrodia cinnamomea]
MAEQTFILHQPIFKAHHPPVHVMQLNETALTERMAADFLQTAVAGVIGVAPVYGARGVLVVIAFSTPSRVLHIRLTIPTKKSESRSKRGRKGSSQPPSKGREILLDKFLRDSEYRKLAFDMHRLATALHLDHSLPIIQAIDLQSILPKTTGRHTASTLLSVLGGELQLNKDIVIETFQGQASKVADARNVSLRAWASCQVGSIASLARGLLAVPAINTETFDKQRLDLLAKFIRDADRLYALKPTKVRNDVSAQFSQKSGALNVSLTRFKTRLRTSTSQKVVLETSNSKGRTLTTQGHTARVNGRSATISVDGSISTASKICNVYTIGREEPTTAEEERTDIVLCELLCKSQLLEQPIVRRIFFPSNISASSQAKARRSGLRDVAPEIHFPARPLNDSQAAAVRRILSTREDDQVCLVHGPPGTGKTTVIAACVTSIVASGAKDYGIWLVAQSNVAVKNIAEKLAALEFLDFKLLVSKDFHFDWHEHLYESIETNVIRSDEFADNLVGTSRLLLGSRVILCTLSMLSHPRLMASGFSRLVPIKTVIVDEASQIELGDYLPLLSKFGKNIRKLAFIGDNKQLAPYGQDDLGDLRSIFELAHLRKNAVFLDTQYRMPVPIGDFISRYVYGGRLNTVHTDTSALSCRLVDVHHGREKKEGHSWVNYEEANAVVAIVRKLHTEGKSFRVITPYDSQRNLLESRLKSEKLPWENKCFNVDSFQGSAILPFMV